MLALRMQHEHGHDHVAWEWFGYGQTLAVLPLNDMHTSSIAVTLPQQQMQALLGLDDAVLGVEMARRFQQRLGAMQVAGLRCAYPLVGVYARRFVADRFAVIDDAAVGMHPVTAHGFNFGLLGLQTLARELNAAATSGQPIWNPARLQRYEREHRRATWPLYRTTQFLATMYTDDRRLTRLLRKMALGAATQLPPIRRVISSRLAQPGYAGASTVRHISRMIRQLRP